MIVRILGTLAEVHDDHVVLDREGISYEILICSYAAGELAACRGQQVSLYTMEYLEGSTAGGNMIPRLVGFLHREDRAFFERFITVKGLGVRKAMKALVQSTARVAHAIESGDAKKLAQLPGIGKRAADQIVAQLRGKVTDFAATESEAELPEVTTDEWSAAQRDALEVMLALGERRADAERWLERARQLHVGEHAPDDWVRLAYRVRSSEG